MSTGGRTVHTAAGFQVGWCPTLRWTQRRAARPAVLQGPWWQIEADAHADGGCEQLQRPGPGQCNEIALVMGFLRARSEPLRRDWCAAIWSTPRKPEMPRRTESENLPVPERVRVAVPPGERGLLLREIPCNQQTGGQRRRSPQCRQRRACCLLLWRAPHRAGRKSLSSHAMRWLRGKGLRANKPA